MDSIVYPLLIFAIVCHVVSSTGPKCYECDKVPDAQDCDKVVTCADNQKCYSQRFIGGDLREFFKLGCTDNDICVTDAFSFFNGFGFGKKRGISKRHGPNHPLAERAAAKDDMVLCLQCCDGEYCNNNLCGASEQHKNPRCFQCDQLEDPRNCDQVEECGTHDSCFVVRTEQGPNHALQYKLGCMSELQCKAAETTSHNLGCFKCCKDKPYCNLNACFSNATSPAQGVVTTNGVTTTTRGTTPSTPSTTSAPPPPSVSLSTGQNLSTMITRPVRVGCTSDPGVKIQWTFNGSTSLPQGAYINGTDLQIAKLNQTNAGKYKCIAISSTGGISVAQVNVHIRDTPAIVLQVSKTPIDHLLSENETLTLECRVVGYPDPTVTWTYEGLGGETNIPARVMFSDNDRKITIKQYNSAHDDGKWTCLAKNSVGQSKGYTNIP